MQKITPFLWFDGQAEAAMEFYLSVFDNARPLHISRCAEGGAGPPGQVMTASFLLEGQEFIALNGGPQFRFTPAISFVVNCETQAEIDRYWDRLSTGGEIQQCGWLTDRFGVSWQILPKRLGELLGGPDPQRSNHVMQALLQMQKLEIDQLQRAYDDG